MAAIKNLRIYQDQESLTRLRDEYRMIGFDVELEPGTLTVFALRRKKPKKKDDDRSERPARNKRAENHA